MSTTSIAPVRGQTRFAVYAWFVVAYNLAVILWGAYVRVTKSGAGCGGHWPLCNGELVPRAPQAATLIEYTHRLSSGLVAVFVALLVYYAFRLFPAGSLVRRAAVFAAGFTLSEALLGAMLVKLDHVAGNTSAWRGVSLSVHLVNTLLLLASLALTARLVRRPPFQLRIADCGLRISNKSSKPMLERANVGPANPKRAGGAQHSRSPEARAARREGAVPLMIGDTRSASLPAESGAPGLEGGTGGAPAVLGRGVRMAWRLAVAALLLTGVTGAVAALGDTLFAATSVAEGIRMDFSAAAHPFLRVRLLHPVLAAGLAAGLLVVASCALYSQNATRTTGRLGAALIALTLAQLGLGVADVLLMAPVWLQLLHLLGADLLAIVFVLLSVELFQRGEEHQMATGTS